MKAKVKKRREGRCVYCEYPERYNLTATTITAKFITPAYGRQEAVVEWHEEAVLHLAGFPRKRIQCQATP